MKLDPRNNHVIVEPLEAEMTDGGILVVENEEDANILKGTVVAVGPGKYTHGGVLIAPNVKEGDIIIAYAGRKFYYGQKVFHCVDGELIVGVVEE